METGSQLVVESQVVVTVKRAAHDHVIAAPWREIEFAVVAQVAHDVVAAGGIELLDANDAKVLLKGGRVVAA